MPREKKKKKKKKKKKAERVRMGGRNRMSWSSG
jgi:hypothetical protein